MKSTVHAAQYFMRKAGDGYITLESRSWPNSTHPGCPSARVRKAGAGFPTVYTGIMTDDRDVRARLTAGEPVSAEELLPVVYDELRKMADEKLRHERPGQTLQATALVHEAYARLVRSDPEKHWDSRGHFFAAAAESMRRILIDQARRKQADKHGGQWGRHRLSSCELECELPSEELLAVHESLDRLAAIDAIKAELVKLRYFAGMTIHQAGEALGISPATADRYWAYARAWLHADLRDSET